MATARAATTCAPRPPPISRAVSPTRTIAAPWARAAKKRRPESEGPNSSSATRATAGVRGG